jgi:hypothetical protein
VSEGVIKHINDEAIQTCNKELKKFNTKMNNLLDEHKILKKDKTKRK